MGLVMNQSSKEQYAGSLEYYVADKTLKGITQRRHHAAVVEALLHGIGDEPIRAAEEIRILTKSSAKSRAYMAASGVIDPLVSMLITSADMVVKEASMLALLNLAVGNERNKIAIVNFGAIPPLVELLRSETQELIESTVVLMLTLSAADSNKVIIGKSGAIPLLVKVLTMSKTQQGKEDAIMTLYNLSTCSRNLVPILEARAIRPLLVFLKACKKASRAAEKTVAILEAMAMFGESRADIANEEGGILALVEVVENGSGLAREHAVSALLTMCENNTTHKYRRAILEEGAIPGLLELTIQGSSRAQKKAKRLLHLLRDSGSSSSSSSSSSGGPPQRSFSASAILLESMVYMDPSDCNDAETGEKRFTEMLAEVVIEMSGPDPNLMTTTGGTHLMSRSNSS